MALCKLDYYYYYYYYYVPRLDNRPGEERRLIEVNGQQWCDVDCPLL